jgi:hypothetical protein
MTDTGWIHEGAQVAEYSSHIMRANARITTIERLTKTQIVLANGVRYNRTTMRPVGDTSYRSELIPADDPRVTAVQVSDLFSEMAAKLEGVLKDVRNRRSSIPDALNEIEQAVRAARRAIASKEK